MERRMSGLRLSDRFKEAQGSPIEWRGKTIRMMYDLPLEASDRLTINFLRSSDDRAQALRVRGRGGRFEVNDRILADLGLWSDTAPRAVTLRPRPRSNNKLMTARVWNAWRDPTGVMQAWIGDAGLVVEETEPHRAVIHCSDGFDEPDFADLVVELTVASETSVRPS